MTSVLHGQEHWKRVARKFRDTRGKVQGSGFKVQHELRTLNPEP
jgi:hypothetical protein